MDPSWRRNRCQVTIRGEAYLFGFPSSRPAKEGPPSMAARPCLPLCAVATALLVACSSNDPPPEEDKPWYEEAQVPTPDWRNT